MIKKDSKDMKILQKQINLLHVEGMLLAKLKSFIFVSRYSWYMNFDPSYRDYDIIETLSKKIKFIRIQINNRNDISVIS